MILIFKISLILFNYVWFSLTHCQGNQNDHQVQYLQDEYVQTQASGMVLQVTFIQLHR
jgi:hypothetical protein